MATTIVTKKGSGAPAASDLVEGELAVDTTNGRLYTENSSAAVVELGSNPSGDVTFADNGKAIFGAGSDLQIYHDGSNSWVSDQGTGQLILESGGAGVYIQKGATETMANFVADGSVSLYYDNAKKFETTATGVDVTGNVVSDTLSTNGDVFINNTAGTVSAGYLYSDSDDFVIRSYTSDKDIIFKGNDGGSVIEAMRIDMSAGGNVGIGLSSGISSKLHVNTEISIGADGDNRAIVGYTPNRFYIGTRQSGTNYFDTVSVSGGNLLVGGTSAGEDGAVSISGTGYIQARIDNDTVAYFDRTGSGDDGEVIRIQQNGGTVGSIGTEGGDLVIGSRASGHKGVRFGANYIAPVDTSNSFEDNTTDLGLPAVRFKDLYLSGGAYLGGTTAANYLEDYEEGLWTLTITTSGTGESVSIGSTTGTYTKIGRQVTATIYTSGVNVSAAGSGAVLLGGLPFTCSNGIQFYAVPSFGHTTLFSYEPDGYVTVNTNYITVTRVGTTTSNALSVGNPRYMMMTVTYFTDS